MLNFRPALVLLFVVTLQACATDRAAEVRTERQWTVGANIGPAIGGQYRPNADWGVDAGLALFPHGAPAKNPSDLFWGALEDAARDLKQTGSTITVGASWYPFNTSAFRTGFGLFAEQATIEFDSLRDDAAGETQTSRIKYERSAQYLGVPLGWHWIWENGFTFGLDLGARLRLAHSETIKEDGGDSVDADDRDDYIKKTVDDRKVLLGGAMTYLGYSF